MKRALKQAAKTAAVSEARRFWRIFRRRLAEVRREKEEAK